MPSITEQLVFYFKICGVWLPDKNENNRKFYIIWMCFIAIIFDLSLNISQIIFIIENRNNLDEIAAASSIFVSIIAAIVKKYNIINNLGLVKDLIQQCDNDIFKPFNAKQKKIIDDGEIMISKLYWIFGKAVWITLIIWFILPFLDTKEVAMLPIRTWLPFDHTSGWGYFIGFIYVIITLSYYAILVLNLDISAVTLLNYLATYCDLLCDNLANLVENSQDVALKTGRNVSEVADLMIERAVKFHVALLEFKNKLQNLYNLSLFLQFGLCIVLFSFNLLRISVVEVLSTDMVWLIIYELSSFCQIFIYCWSGNQVIVKSDRISQSAYKSDWDGLNNSARKKLLILMIRSRDPIKVYIGGIIEISLVTLIKVYKTSFSYYTFLKTIEL